MQHGAPDKFRVFQTWILNHPIGKIVKLHRLFIILTTDAMLQVEKSSR